MSSELRDKYESLTSKIGRIGNDLIVIGCLLLGCGPIILILIVIILAFVVGLFGIELFGDQ